jgi:FSR family fosmidomycin resistance protein-like MFS transporter
VLLAVVQQNSRGNASFINGVYMTTNFVISSLMVLLVGACADSMGLEATFRLTAFIALGSIPFAFLLQSR